MLAGGEGSVDSQGWLRLLGEALRGRSLEVFGVSEAGRPGEATRPRDAADCAVFAGGERKASGMAPGIEWRVVDMGASSPAGFAADTGAVRNLPGDARRVAVTSELALAALLGGVAARVVLASMLVLLLATPLRFVGVPLRCALAAVLLLAALPFCLRGEAGRMASVPVLPPRRLRVGVPARLMFASSM